METKQQLRNRYTLQIQAFTEQEMQESNAKIALQVKSLPVFRNADTIFCYVSVGHEVDTLGLINYALEQGKRVAVPRCVGAGVMEVRQIQSLESLRTAAYGLLEPDETAPLLLPSEIGVAIVPCIACDRAGYRLGHGGGYYDRYLPRTSCETLCLCREVLLREKLPHEAFDVPVGVVVTESQILGFEKKKSICKRGINNANV